MGRLRIAFCVLQEDSSDARRMLFECSSCHRVKGRLPSSHALSLNGLIPLSPRFPASPDFFFGSLASPPCMQFPNSTTPPPPCSPLPLTPQYALKRPHAVNFSRKNPIHPFEDASSLEFFASKNDASLFLTGLHSKKRPDNLVFTRMFDGRVLDMMELGIDQIKEMSEFEVSGTCCCLHSPCCGSHSPRIGVNCIGTLAFEFEQTLP